MENTIEKMKLSNKALDAQYSVMDVMAGFHAALKLGQQEAIEFARSGKMPDLETGFVEWVNKHVEETM